MLHRILMCATLAATATLAACSDRPPLSPPLTASAAAPAPERLARQFAKALRNPVFRAYLKAQLDASPFPEHKLQFQTFLGAGGGRAKRYFDEDVEPEARAAIALEVYFPVAAHRATWTGDEHVLVATGIRDRKSTRLNSSHRLTSRMPSSA